ncbi:MAG: K(+)-transporting ATPase subunit C [Candidatus Hydrogenedentales bacterium]|jgi:K+-transporting ATPase ATPase C chain
MKTILYYVRPAVLSTLLLAVILCGAYPVAVWAVAQTVLPDKANGSLLAQNGVVVGSALIGQVFTQPKYFHSRPSAAGAGYDATASSGSNLGPIADKLLATVAERVNAYRAENGLSLDVSVPADAVTASGSGLDPHISPRNAELQCARVAKARGLAEETVKSLVAEHTEGRTLGVLGEPRVNVVVLNQALDALR